MRRWKTGCATAKNLSLPKGSLFTLSKKRSYASLVAPERRKDLASVNQADIEAFRKILSQEETKPALDGVIGGRGTVATEADVLETLNLDWLKKYKGRSTVALFPKTTKHVSEILKYCNEKRIGIVPQGLYHPSSVVIANEVQKVAIPAWWEGAFLCTTKCSFLQPR